MAEVDLPLPGSVEAPAPLDADVVVVGAGPAGLAAAAAAAHAGARVIVLDAAPAAGGQVWRARLGVADAGVAQTLRELDRGQAEVLAATRVVMPLPGCTLLIEGPAGARQLRWRRLVLATGARERLLPFPGWTLPGVFGAGGLQALVKGGWPIAGQRVLVAGTGPLLLAAAATLRSEGAHVVGIVEEAPMPALLGFGFTLLRHPRQAAQALKLAGALRGVPFFAGSRIVAAEGDGRLEQVILAAHPRAGADDGDAPASAARPRAMRPRFVTCDALAAGWGLVPQVELAQALGCALAPRFGASAIVIDAAQRTSVAGVFAAGECCGVAGVRAAELQGAMAGAAAAHELHGPELTARPAAVAGRAAAALTREYGFAAAVARTFAVTSSWAARLDPDTLVCRCEDVPWSALRGQPDLRSAKLATRCGMGHCQGRLCHDALVLMTEAPRLAARPPAMPVALGAFLAIEDADGSAAFPHRPRPREETPS